MFPLVVALAIVVGIITGWITSLAFLHLSTPEFVKGLKLFYVFKDTWFGLLKSATFGFTITMVGCVMGLSTRGGAEGVGRSSDPGPGLLGGPDSDARRLLGGHAAAVIEFRGLSKAFGGKPVLAGLSLEVQDGETMVIIGYSGTGKSVALKHIVGLLEPDEGDVAVDGRVVSTLERAALNELRRDIGYVFQFAALFDSMTVADNVALGLRRRRLTDEEIDERVEEALAVVDLTGAGEQYPAELSGGMRKRVGIARAIALRPRYILYDEPTTGLDPVTSAVIDRLMVRTRERLGVTGVVVTHDMRSAYTVGDRIAMLYEGRIRQVGTVAEVQATRDPVVRQFIEGRAP